MRSPIFTARAGRQIDQTRPLGIVAGQHRARRECLERHRDARIEVGDQQNPRGALADLGQPPDQALAGDRRLAARDTPSPLPALNMIAAHKARRRNWR